MQDMSHLEGFDIYIVVLQPNSRMGPTVEGAYHSLDGAKEFWNDLTKEEKAVRGIIGTDFKDDQETNDTTTSSDFQAKKNNVVFTLKELQDYLEDKMRTIEPEDYAGNEGNEYYQDRGYHMALGNLYDILDEEAEMRVDYDEKELIDED